MCTIYLPKEEENEQTNGKKKEEEEDCKVYSAFPSGCCFFYLAIAKNEVECSSLLFASASFCNTGALVNWESHGEIVDLESLNKPAIDENLIRELQSSNDLAAATWTSGLNERFEGMNLADAKVLLGVLQDKSGKSSLPPRAYTQEEIKNVPQEFDWRTDARARTVLPYEKYATKRTVEAVGRLEVSKQ